MRRGKLEEDQALWGEEVKKLVSEFGFERSEFAQLLLTTSRDMSLRASLYVVSLSVFVSQQEGR